MASDPVYEAYLAEDAKRKARLEVMKDCKHWGHDPGEWRYSCCACSGAPFGCDNCSGGLFDD